MNHYSQVLEYLKGLAEADDFVNTVTQGDMSDVDLNKANIFNMVHIDVLSFSFGEGGRTIIFDLELLSAQVRDSNKRDEGTKFWGQNNKIDNLNETMAVINRMWLKMLVDFEDNNINVVSSSPAQEVTEWNTNLLDGWLFPFSIELPNTTINLCQ